MFPERRLGGPIGHRTLGIPESREGEDIDHGGTRIEIVGETIVGIIGMMIRWNATEIDGEMIAGDPRGIATGNVRGADVTGGGVMIAGRLIHEGCGR